MVERRRHVVVFVREPVAGRVKTRLGRDIGMVPAAWWQRHQLRSLLRRIGGDPRWQVVLAVTPDRAIASPGLWPRHLPRVAQGQGDVGQRMARAIRACPPGPVLLIGSDIPGITSAHLAEAFGRLGQADAVFGPSPDGGFWLVGLARRRQRLLPGLFGGTVRWSTRHALADTLAPLWGRRISFVTPMQDVDDAADLPGGPV